MSKARTYDARASLPSTHPLSAYLYELISTKRTNLCVSADVHSSSALLKLAEEVGDHICVLKTHADSIDDFGERTIRGLKEISRRKKFLIFEDRKFADIGNTVTAQYARGPLRIADWAHIVNAHVISGPAIITSLKQAAEKTVVSMNQSVSTEVYTGTPAQSDDEEEDEDEEDTQSKANGDRSRKHDTPLARKGSIVTTTHIYQTVETREGHRSPNRLRSPPNESAIDEDQEVAVEDIPEPPMLRGLLLLAQMSSQGNLMGPDYVKACIKMARDNKDFVMGYIAQEGMNKEEGENFITMTPGVQLGATGDSQGQQYRTPELVIKGEGCDIIIVGRGIYGAQDKAGEAKRYREEGWKAYKARLRA